MPVDIKRSNCERQPHALNCSKVNLCRGDDGKSVLVTKRGLRSVPREVLASLHGGNPRRPSRSISVKAATAQVAVLAPKRKILAHDNKLPACAIC